jgi:hypothetical protein
MLVRSGVIGGQPVIYATHVREVPLGQIDSKLKGVVAMVPEPALVGAINKTPAILGMVPEPKASSDEVATFVQTLLASNRIAFDPDAVRYGIKSATAGDGRKRLPTHRIRQVGGKKLLERVRFACGEWS